jgi:hypothetical protein
MRITLSGGPIRGRQKIIAYLRYNSPDQIMLQGEHNHLGPLLRVTQNDQDAAVYLMKEPVHFYQGSLDELNAHPEALFGLRPTDMVRTLLVGREVIELLQAKNPGTLLPPSPRKNFKYWGLLTKPAWNRFETYAICKRDGLTKTISIRDENQDLRIHVTYHRYEYFDDVLFPSRFDLLFQDSGLKLRISVEGISSQPIPEKAIQAIFSTSPPKNAGIDPEPLSDWFARPDISEPKL